MAPVFEIGFEAMASRCQVRLAAADLAEAHRLAQPAIDEVRRIERKYSRYRRDSVISRINAGAGAGTVACDDETQALLAYADTLYEASGGLFDITSGVLRRAWNFQRAQVPDQASLHRALDLVGWRRVDRERQAIRLPLAGMEIDFGGFGKEYAADRAGAILLERGVRCGYVNLGGDMRVLGPQPDGRPWAIGIQDPRRSGQTIAQIEVSRGALATSGDYERFFELDGRRYCHVLDPVSGMPVTHWRSVSVLGPLAIAAGSCSTIAMLMQARGLAFLDGAGIDYLAVDQDGNLHSKNIPTACAATA